MTETAQTDARAQDLPEENREPSVGNCNELQRGRRRRRLRGDFSLKRRKKHVRKLLGRIERAHREGQREKARRLTRLYLRSEHAIVVAAVEANRKLPRSQREDEEHVKRLATCLDPWQGTDERVLVSTKPKENSGYRIICQFGPENRTLQTLVKNVLEVQTDLHPAQFANQGGRSAAGRAVIQTLEEGYTHVVSTDITDCFGSFGGEQVKRRLPLPSRIVEKIVLGATLNLVPFRTHLVAGSTSTLLARCQRGLPHGSISSPISAESLLSTIPSEFSGGRKPIMYVDNLLVFTHGGKEADAVSMTMGLALQRNRAGIFEPRYVNVRRCCDGFDFLGSRFRKRRNSPVVWPSRRNLEKFSQKYRSRCHVAVLEYLRTGRRGKLCRVRRYVQSWHASFDQWEERDLHKSSVLDELRRWEKLCHVIRRDLAASKEAE